MDKTMPNYKGMYEKQEEQIAHLKCVCEGQEKKLLYYERKVNKLKKKNKKLKKQLNEVESNYLKFIILLSEVTNERYCTRNIINDIVDELCERYKVKARQVYYELPNFGKAVIKLTLENDYLINIDIDKQLLEAIEEKEIKLRINTMFVEEFCRLALKEVEK